MKKILFVAFMITLLFSALTVNAQTYTNSQEAYEYCKQYVHNGDDAYDAKYFGNAQRYYEQALECNMQCPDKKYISDKKLYKKIDNCKYALTHEGKTKQEVRNETVGAVLGTALVVGALVGAATSTHHDVYEVHHHEHHEPFHEHHHDPFHEHHHHF